MRHGRPALHSTIRCHIRIVPVQLSEQDRSGATVPHLDVAFGRRARILQRDPSIFRKLFGQTIDDFRRKDQHIHSIVGIIARPIIRSEISQRLVRQICVFRNHSFYILPLPK